MILVAGGTGRLGTLVVQRLQAAGQPVRVLTRDGAHAAHLGDVEVAVGDVRDRASLDAAVRGTRTVVSAVQGFAGSGHVTPASVDRDGNRNLMGAAAAVGARFVLLSIVDASTTHPMELFRMKAAAEQALRASALDWAVVRAAAFLETHEDLMRRTAGRSGRPVVLGRGWNPIAFVRVAQVVEAVVEVVGRPTLGGAVVDVVGPTLTMDEVAAGLEPELGPGARRPRHVPRAVLRTLSLARGTQVSRLATASLVMDTADMTVHAPAA